MTSTMAERITTPSNRDSTAEDVIARVDLTGKHAIVAGASSGIGVETARKLAFAGAEVTLAVRDVQAGASIAADITSQTGNPNVFVAPLDLNSHASITAFTKAWKIPLHILVNNAGIMALPKLTLSPEGWEQQLVTNFLGHFELTLGLHDALAAAGHARVVSVSSLGHGTSPVVFDDMHFANRSYEGFAAYGKSITANVLFAVEASKRWAKDGIVVNACHPSAVQKTNLGRHMKLTPEVQKYMQTASYKTVEQGAAKKVLLAASPLVEDQSGRYLETNNKAKVATGWGPQYYGGVQPPAIDAEDAARLWDVSLELLQQRAGASWSPFVESCGSHNRNEMNPSKL